LIVPEGIFERQVDRLFEDSPQCVLAQLYGGIPAVGGYRDYTEYEVGVQHIAEAAHCILGSVGKVWDGYGRGSSEDSWRIERGHFNEEMGIIEKSIREYSKEFYDGRTFTQSRYRQDSIKSMQKNSPILKLSAIQKRRLLLRDKKLYDPKLFGIAWWAYTLLKDLAEAVLVGVQGAVDHPTSNAFRDPNVRISVKRLREKLEEAYQ